MIELYQQEKELAFRPGLEPEKCYFTIEQNRKIDRSVNLPYLLTNLADFEI